jgi:hypothetical protein
MVMIINNSMWQGTYDSKNIGRNQQSRELQQDKSQNDCLGFDSVTISELCCACKSNSLKAHKNSTKLYADHSFFEEVSIQIENRSFRLVKTHT